MNSSWQKRCSTVSTTRSTATRVEERWGREAYAAGDRWWRSLTEDEKKSWQRQVAQLGADWVAAAGRHVAPDSAEAQALAQRHVEWLRSIPGTPGALAGPTKEYVVGLAEMYVADPRFAEHYGGPEGAAFVRDAMKVFADRHL